MDKRERERERERERKKERKKKKRQRKKNYGELQLCPSRIELSKMGWTLTLKQAQASSILIPASVNGVAKCSDNDPVH